MRIDSPPLSLQILLQSSEQRPEQVGISTSPRVAEAAVRLGRRISVTVLATTVTPWVVPPTARAVPTTAPRDVPAAARAVPPTAPRAVPPTAPRTVPSVRTARNEPPGAILPTGIEDLAGADVERRGDSVVSLRVTRARLPRVIRWRQTGQAECESSHTPIQLRQKTCMQGVLAGFLNFSKQIAQSPDSAISLCSLDRSLVR